MMKTMLKYGAAGLGALVLLGSAGADAAWKPSKRLEIVTHVRSTSSTYAFAKAMEKELDKILKKGAKVLTVRGARGDRARRYVRIKNADNNHMWQIITPSQVNNPILAKQETRPWMFTPLALLVVTPNLMAVNAKSPYKSMKDVIDKACKDPSKVIHGGGFFGNITSLNGIMLQRKTGCKWVYTPFDDQGIIQLLGGHIDFVMENPAQLLKFVRAGRMRILAASEKLNEFPNVPTYEEAGYGFRIFKQYRGAWMGGKVNPEAAKFWINTLDKVRKTKGFQKYVSKNNLSPVWITGKKLANYMRHEFDIYMKFGKEYNLIGKKRKKKKKKKKSS